MKNSWDKFWEKRDKPLTERQKNIFFNNFSVLYTVAIHHFVTKQVNFPLRVLEIGCGRATISDCFALAGCQTVTMDLVKRLENVHDFYTGDVLDSEWPVEKGFDLIFSYGLLEHFNPFDQWKIMDNCNNYLHPDTGVQLHYVVPSKLTNILEDRDVYRSNAEYLLGRFEPIWCYPIVGQRWVTNKWLAKGFVIRKEVSHESAGSDNSKITKH